MVWRQGKEREGEGRRRQAEPASARPPAAAAARPDAGGGSGHRRQRGGVGKRWRGVAPETRGRVEDDAFSNFSIVVAATANVHHRR